MNPPITRTALFILGLTLAGSAHAALETAAQGIALLSIGAVIVMTPGAVVGALLARFAAPRWRAWLAAAFFVALWTAFMLSTRRDERLSVLLLNPVIVFVALPYVAGCVLGLRLAKRRVPGTGADTPVDDDATTTVQPPAPPPTSR
jgi:uncharacterized membrane protein YfcA